MSRISIRSIRYRRPKHPTWDLDLERAIVADPAAISAPWDLALLFSRAAPVETEIGFGKGAFLLAAAERWPERNWLGIEYAAPCVSLVAERAAKRGLTNVRLVRADANEAINNIPDRSIGAYHIYFPDPWPKKRHHKRRLITRSFAEKLDRTLAPDGLLYLATDFEDYYAEMLPAVESAGLLLLDAPDDRQDEVFRTNYERKFMGQGKTIYRARFGKPARRE